MLRKNMSRPPRNYMRNTNIEKLTSSAEANLYQVFF